MKKTVPVQWAAEAITVVFLLSSAISCTPVIEKLWEFPISSPTYSTPLVTDEAIIFGSESGTLHAVDKNGQARWSFQAPSSQIFSHPKSDGKLIFFGATNQKFYAVDMRGRLKWQFAASERIKSDPTVVDDLVYVTSYDGHVYALKTDTGKKIWQFPPAPKPDREVEEEVSSPPVPTSPVPQPRAFSYAAPTVVNKVLYVGNLDGYLYAIHTSDGSMKWRHKVGGGITSTAQIQDNIVYFGSKDDHVYALDAVRGTRVIWKFKTGDDVLSSPQVIDGVLYIGSNDKNFYALDAKTGEEKCHFTTKGPVISNGTPYKNLIIFGGGQGDGRIYALNQTDCRLVHSVRTGYKIESDPVIVGNRLFVTSGDRKLYAFKINKTE